MLKLDPKTSKGVDFLNVFEERTKDLNDNQKTIIFQIVKKVIYCEQEIPVEFWCEVCKARIARANELMSRFNAMNKMRKKYREVSQDPNTF